MKSLLLRLCLALGLTLLAVGTAQARPTYFEAMKSHFAVIDESNLDTCLVCHMTSLGGGTRNPFGLNVQQYLYAGKSIQETLQLVEDLDSDNDGSTNVEELATFLTLPGFSCENFEEASGAPLQFDAWVTPGVATCRNPVEIAAVPSSAGFITESGATDTFTITIWNLGYQDTLTITDLALTNVVGDGLSLVSSLTLPVTILPNDFVDLELHYAPLGTSAVTGTLEVTSNDPVIPILDVPINGLGIERNLAPLAERLACRASLQKRFASYSKSHLREWAGCFAQETAGYRCREAKREQKLGRALVKLEASIAGPKDKHCQGVGMNAARLDMPETCGGECASISLTGMASIRSCALCRQETATRDALIAAFGTSSPDLPTALGSSEASKCAKTLGKLVARVIPAIQRELADCAHEKLEDGGDRSDCAAERADRLAQLRAKVDAAVSRCVEVDGLSGCAFEEEADPACLGDAVVEIGHYLVDTLWDEY